MWGIFVNLLISAAASYVYFLLSPKPKPPKPATLEDFDIPKAEEGQSIGKVFGTVLVRDATVHWYGDLKTRAIKSKSGKK